MNISKCFWCWNIRQRWPKAYIQSYSIL